jgi:thioredoxin reductase (NADPH)
VVEKGEVGGLASTSPRIENYLGFPSGIAGADLTRRAHDQANRLGAEILSLRTVRRIRVDEPYRIVELDDGREITASTVLIATGAQFRTLPAAGAERFHGTGIFYACTHADLPQVAGKRVHVVGGGNAAAQAALLLARTAAHVTMLVRGPGPIASQYLLDAIAASPIVEMRIGAEVTEARGEGRLQELVIAPGGVEPSDGLYVFVGVRPSSELVADLCRRNDKGFIMTGPQLGGRPEGWPLDRDPMLLECSVPGIFAAGDVRAGTIGRVAWAAGEGGATVSMVLEYLRGWKTGSRGAAEA